VWLAQAAEPTDARGIVVDAHVTQKDGAYALDLRVSAPGGDSREQLAAAQCETLAGVVALKVALAADPSARQASLSHGAAAMHGSVRMAGGAIASVLPAVGPLLSLAGAIRGSRIALELSGGYAFAREVVYPERRDLGAEVGLLYGGARFCLLPEVGAVELPICAGADVGLMRATGRGKALASSLTSSLLFGALVLSPAIRWPMSARFGLWLGLDAQVAFLRPQFQVRGLPRLYRPDALGAKLLLALEWCID
jgi:hypothetical protein